MRTFKIYALSNFQTCNTVLLTTVPRISKDVKVECVVDKLAGSAGILPGLQNTPISLPPVLASISEASLLANLPPTWVMISALLLLSEPSCLLPPSLSAQSLAHSGFRTPESFLLSVPHVLSHSCHSIEPNFVKMCSHPVPPLPPVLCIPKPSVLPRKSPWT